MRVLWITNILFPEAVGILKGNGKLMGSGGWMLGAAEALLHNSSIELAVACPSAYVKAYTTIFGSGIRYFTFPIGKGFVDYNKSYEYYWRQVEHDFLPDVVHIFGSEYTHGLAYVNACGSRHVIVSIQGLVSVYARYFKAGISSWDLVRSITMRDIFKGTLFHEERSFIRRGRLESILLKKVDHIIGRTEWDKSHAWALNPSAQYHFCNETLRTEFYTGSWEYNMCSPHTIFCSQATYPIKGFHQIVKALPLVLKEYPDACVRVAGGGHVVSGTIKERIKMSGYSNYIRRLTNGLGVADNVSYLGPLDAEQMKKEYLNCNVFICPSSIENSPNSLGEAQLLRVPTIAAFVGGIPEFMVDDEEHLYRFEEIEMLAKKICDVFDHPYDTSLSFNNASKRHNPEENASRLLEIYYDVMKY